MEPKMNIKKSEEFRSFYSNQVNIHSSFFDFVIDFGEVEKIEMQGNQPIMNVEVKARVVMSPQHAKAFLQALSKNIESYENQFGPINLPDGGGKSEHHE